MMFHGVINLAGLSQPSFANESHGERNARTKNVHLSSMNQNLAKKIYIYIYIYLKNYVEPLTLL